MGLIRVLFFGLIAILVYTVYKKFLARRGGADPDIEDERLGRLVLDPQCKVYVDSREAVTRDVPGGTLFFCSKACAEEYFQSEAAGKNGK